MRYGFPKTRSVRFAMDESEVVAKLLDFVKMVQGQGHGTLNDRDKMLLNKLSNAAKSRNYKEALRLFNYVVFAMDENETVFSNINYYIKNGATAKLKDELKYLSK